MPNRFTASTIVPMTILLICMILWAWVIPQQIAVFSEGIGPGPRFFPYLVTEILIGLSGIRLLQVVLWPAQDPADASQATLDWRAIALAALCLGVFYLVIYLIGALPACFVAMIAFARAFMIQLGPRILLVSSVATLALWSLFAKLASVPLPRGLVWRFVSGEM